jgi:hypothetical protein
MTSRALFGKVQPQMLMRLQGNRAQFDSSQGPAISHTHARFGGVPEAAWGDPGARLSHATPSMTSPFHRLAGFLLVGCAFLASSAAMAQQGQDLNSLVIANKQCMLSERVLKSYAQEFLRVQSDKSASALQQGIAELRSNNAALKPSAPEAAAPLLSKQGKLIDQLAGIVAQPPSPETLSQAFSVSEELWVNAESTTRTYHGTAPAALLSLASSQRMLTQRTAAMYFLQQTPLKSKELKGYLGDADSKFKNTTSAFGDHESDFPGIAANLELARLQMIFFDNAVHHIDAPTKEQMQSVATASDRILDQMEELTKNVLNRILAQSPPTKTKHRQPPV